MTVTSSYLVKMEMPKVEMGNDTGAAEESWEGLGAEDEEGMDEENVDKGKDKNVGEDLVSEIVLTSLFANRYCLASCPSGCSLWNCGGGQGQSTGAGPISPAPLGSLGGLGKVLGLGNRDSQNGGGGFGGG